MQKKNKIKLISLLFSLSLLAIFTGFSIALDNKSDVMPFNNLELKTSSTANKYNHQSPLSILIYTEYADLASGGEFDNTLAAIENDYGEYFNYDNLTDYTKLTSELPGHQVFLILEQEKTNSNITKIIGETWSTQLQSFVSNGGVVILMDCYSLSSLEYGITSHIFNQSGLMTIESFHNRFGSTITLDNIQSALARRVSSSWTGPSGTLSYETNDYTFRVVNYVGETVVAHKILGKGHIVLMGFDLYNPNSEVEKILGNAVRLGKHIIFDESHSQTYNIYNEFSGFSNRLIDEGYAISNMVIFSQDFLKTADVLVITTGPSSYTSGEIDIIDDFVKNGGGLFVTTDWGSHGDQTDSILENFGIERYDTSLITDSDDNSGDSSHVIFDGDNILEHSCNLYTNSIQIFAGTGFSSYPSNSYILIKTDDDGTAELGGSPAIEVPIAIASITAGNGRLIALGDTNFLDSSANSDGDSYNNFYDERNEYFLVNSIQWLFSAGQKERKILFEESRSPYLTIFNHYSGIGKLLTENGYTISWMNTFQTGLINETDILVIYDGASNYTVSEQTHIKTFVNNGGGLFLIGDWSTYGQQINTIANEFGIYINTTSYLEDSDDGPTSQISYNHENFGNHPIMDDIRKILIDRSCALSDIGSGTSLVNTDTDGTCVWHGDGIADGIPVFCALEHQKGKVIVFTDINFLSIGNVLFDEDNEYLTLNSMLWLAEGLPSDGGGGGIPGYDLLIFGGLMSLLIGIISISIYKKKIK